MPRKTFDAQTFKQALDSCSNELGISLSDNQSTLLLGYWQLLIKWNGAYNLSAIRDPEQIFYKHIVDSIALVPLFRTHQVSRCLDVGTGGGLPGIPLSICLPDTHFTLLDSVGKKMRFLFQVVQSLTLMNVDLKNCRVESFHTDQGFDVIISRAFASIAKFTGLCRHLLSESGEFWAMKGADPLQELSEIEKHYIVSCCHQLDVPGVDGERCLLRIQKMGNA